MATHATFSMRLETELLQRIDHSASQAGLSRTAYVLSMLPEYHQQPSPSTKTPAEQQSKPSR